jgi:hypothetical protein
MEEARQIKPLFEVGKVSLGVIFEVIHNLRSEALYFQIVGAGCPSHSRVSQVEAKVDAGFGVPTHGGCRICEGGESKEDDDEFGEHGDEIG